MLEEIKDEEEGHQEEENSLLIKSKHHSGTRLRKTDFAEDDLLNELYKSLAPGEDF